MTIVCIAASARRLWFVAYPTALHPDDVLVLLRRSGQGNALAHLHAAAVAAPEAEWERELCEALAVSSPDVRAALVNEQLTELDIRVDRWSRVPRVCASVATSVGILLGTLVLRNGLATTGLIDEAFVWSILSDAVAVACFGIVGTAFCIGAHAHARQAARRRLQSADKMIEALEEAALKAF